MEFKNFRNYEVLNAKPLITCIDAETMIIFCKPLSQYIKETVKEIIIAKEIAKKVGAN